MATRRDMQQPRRGVAARRNTVTAAVALCLASRSQPEELRGAITFAGEVAAAVSRCHTGCGGRLESLAKRQ